MNFTLKSLIASGLILAASLPAVASDKLTGTPIGARGYDYNTSSATTTNLGLAFDGNVKTFYASYDRSYGWVGLDLGKPYVIDKAGIAPRNDESYGPKRALLGVLEGANSSDFMDAVPIYMVKENLEIGKVTYVDINCSRGFRYVRWVGPNDSRCNIAELEFYGTPGEGDDSEFFQATEIPTVYINTLNNEIPYDKEHDITSQIIIIDNNKIDTDQPGTCRERGNASRTFPKKPWRIKFDKKQRVLGAPAKAKKWTLINNYGDKTLLRNVIAFEMSRRIGMPYTPFCQPVDVFMNGEYKGCYQLCDQLDVNSDRVDITEMGPEDISGDALTGGYLVEIDAYANQEPSQSWFSSNRGTPVTIKSPGDDEIAPVQKNYIKGYFQKLEDALYSSDYNKEDAQYFDYIDIESFLKYFILGELDGNTDTFWSTYMSKDRGQDKFIVGPLWDIDLGFDNDSRTYPINNKSTFLALSGSASLAGGMSNFVNRIISNSFNREELSRIWSIMRTTPGGFDEESLMAFIDGWYDKIKESADLNFTRWDILGKAIHMNPRTSSTYEGEVDFVKDFIKKRLDKLDGFNFFRYDDRYNSVCPIVAEGENIMNVIVRGQAIYVDNVPEFKVFSVSGTQLFSGSDATEPLNPGIYIVNAEGFKAEKVVIR